VIAAPRIEYPVDADWLAVADLVIAPDGRAALAEPRLVPTAANRDGRWNGDTAALPNHYPPTSVWRAVPPARLAEVACEVIARMKEGDYRGAGGERLMPGDFDALIERAGFDLTTIEAILPAPQHRPRWRRTG
jgi:hypothetical protein